VGLPEAQELVALFPVTKEWWDSRAPEADSEMHHNAAEAMRRFGEVTTELSRTVTEEYEIDGLRLLPEDEDGNPTPPMVAVRYTAMVVPNEEQQQILREFSDG